VKKTLGAVLLFLGAAYAPGQVRAAVDTSNASDLDSEPTAAGPTLKYFSQIDDGVYKGSKPKSDADYRFLQSLHVKYIVDLQVLPLMTLPEKRRAKQYGITLIPGTMNASPISPSEKHVDKILAILRDERYHPVYFHCKFGRDRTAVIAALYKMYFLGMPPQEATRYLHDSGYGFKFGWLRSGLTRYLEKHPTPPADLLSHPRNAISSEETDGVDIPPPASSR
jgi:protein tyrosine/serine phosphatase